MSKLIHPLVEKNCHVCLLEFCDEFLDNVPACVDTGVIEYARRPCYVHSLFKPADISKSRFCYFHLEGVAVVRCPWPLCWSEIPKTSITSTNRFRSTKYISTCHNPWRGDTESGSHVKTLLPACYTQVDVALHPLHQHMPIALLPVRPLTIDQHRAAPPIQSLPIATRRSHIM